MNPGIAIMFLTHLAIQAGSISRNALVNLYNEILDFKHSGLKRDQIRSYQRWGMGRKLEEGG